MGRGKIEIKKIENPTNRQVTFSKRRNGIFKKAQELTVLCDAKVSLIMLSNTEKFYEFTSPTTTTKKMYDEYQQLLGIDLWSTHYERMQENLRKLREINNKRRTEIRQRMGQDLDNLSMQDLCGLEQKMADSLAIIRERKYHVIKTQTDTHKKKVRNLEEIYGNLLLEYQNAQTGQIQSFQSLGWTMRETTILQLHSRMGSPICMVFACTEATPTFSAMKVDLDPMICALLEDY